MDIKPERGHSPGNVENVLAGGVILCVAGRSTR
jgi:hypothetical protein